MCSLTRTISEECLGAVPATGPRPAPLAYLSAVRAFNCFFETTPVLLESNAAATTLLYRNVSYLWQDVVEQAGVFAAHHHAHGQQGQHHGEQAQKAHPPVKEEQHNNGGDGRHRRGGQVGELVGQQVLGEPGVVVDELAQPPRLVPGEKAQGEL